MMTEIHAKPLKSSSSKNDTPLATEEGQIEVKKKTVEKEPMTGATGNPVDKKKKEKKKALKRL